MCTTVLVLGVLAYMRLSHGSGRAMALLSSAVLSVAVGVNVRAYYWNGWNDVSDSLLAWSLWFAVLTIPALLSLAVKHLRTSRPVAA